MTRLLRVRGSHTRSLLRSTSTPWTPNAAFSGPGSHCSHSQSDAGLTTFADQCPTDNPGSFFLSFGPSLGSRAMSRLSANQVHGRVAHTMQYLSTPVHTIKCHCIPSLHTIEYFFLQITYLRIFFIIWPAFCAPYIPRAPLPMAARKICRLFTNEFHSLPQTKDLVSHNYSPDCVCDAIYGKAVEVMEPKCYYSICCPQGELVLQANFSSPFVGK